jgi:LemA protein
MKSYHKLIAAALLVSFLSGCGYNTMQRRDEQVKSAWADVINNYQRRADLIPNLVETVKGFAKQEKDVFLGVAEARASVGQVKVDANDIVNSPAKVQSFMQKQGELSQALSRLMVVVERYPDIKSDKNFLELQRQLKTVEDQIAVARRKYIAEVKDYNVVVRSFPTNITAMIFGIKEKPQFTVENEQAVKVAPKVEFTK